MDYEYMSWLQNEDYKKDCYHFVHDEVYFYL